MWKTFIVLLLGLVALGSFATPVQALCWNPLELFCIFEGEEEQQMQAQAQEGVGGLSNRIVVSSFTKPRYSDLTFDRTSDKINLTWDGGSSYATIQIGFYYAGNDKTYTVGQAQSFGATFDDWVVSNTGSGIKWGGVANVSSVSSTIKANGFYPVFQLVDTSEGMTVSKSNNQLWFNNEVYINWKDDANPNNKFNVFNKTTVYLTDNGQLFHDTVVYDPTITSTNVSLGFHNATVFNSTDNSVNLLGGNLTGYYYFPVINISKYANANVSNITIATTEPAVSNVSISHRTINLSVTDSLRLWYGFEDTSLTSNTIHDYSGNENHGTINKSMMTLNTKYDNNQRGLEWTNTGLIRLGQTSTQLGFAGQNASTWVFYFNTSREDGQDSFISETGANDYIRINAAGFFNLNSVCGSTCQPAALTNNTEYLLFVSVNESHCLISNGSEALDQELCTDGGYKIGATTWAVGGSDNNIGHFTNMGKSNTLYEVLLYNKVLTPDERQSLYNDLWQDSKWSDFTENNLSNPTLYTGNEGNGNFAQARAKLDSDGAVVKVHNATIGINAEAAAEVADQPAGLLDITLHNGNIEVEQNSTFTINFTATCEGAGGCGDVDLNWFYNFSGLDVDDLLNASVGDVQFYNTTLGNTTCSSLGDGGVCNINTTVNATASVGNWSWTGNATNSSSQNGTTTFYVNISLPAVVVEVTPGLLDVTLNNANIQVNQNETFSVNASVTCEGGDCGVVNFTGWFYNFSGLATNTFLNTTIGDLKFYNSSNVANGTCGTLDEDDVCSFNVTINATGTIGNYSFTGNFTNGTHTNGTPTFYVNISLPATVDEPPQFTTVNNNGSSAQNGFVVNWTTTITDGTELSFCWFTHNDSGSFANASVQECDTPVDLSFNITITSTQDTQVCGFFGANDTSNNHNQTVNSCFTVSPSPAGLLNVTLNGSILLNINQNETANLSATAVCEGGNCASVNATMFRSGVGGTGNIDIPVNTTTLGLPLYNNTGLINQTQTLNENDIFEYLVTFNFTGAFGVYNYSINFTNGTHTNGTSGQFNITPIVEVAPALLNGSLDVTLTTSSAADVVQNNTFIINASVTCEGGNCSFITGTIYFNWTGNIGTEVNHTIGDVPVYNVSEVINQTCSTDLGDGETCSTGWLLNLTGSIGTVWTFTINFTTSNTEVLTNGTSITTISITAPPIGLPVQPSLPMCDEPNVIIGTNCTFTTPTLNCPTGFTYDIINLSGVKVVDNGSLANLQGNVWFLNFTQVQEKNDFVIRLCDDTTREVRVRGGDENMTNVAVAILLIGMTFFITKFALELDEKHWPIKLGLFGVVIGFGYGIINLAVKLAESVGASSNVVTTLDGIFLAYTYFALLAFGYIMIRIFIWMVSLFKTDPELVTEQDLEENEKGW